MPKMTNNSCPPQQRCLEPFLDVQQGCRILRDKIGRNSGIGTNMTSLGVLPNHQWHSRENPADHLRPWKPHGSTQELPLSGAWKASRAVRVAMASRWFKRRWRRWFERRWFERELAFPAFPKAWQVGKASRNIGWWHEKFRNQQIMADHAPWGVPFFGSLFKQLKPCLNCHGFVAAMLQYPCLNVWY